MGSNCCKGDAAGGPLRSSSSIYSRSRAGASLDDRFTRSDDAGGVRLTVSAARTDDTGVYTLQASNAAGSDLARVRLEVSADEAPSGDDPPTFLRRLQDLTVKVGTRTRFLVEIISSTECKVTWYRNERRLMEAERISLVRDGHFWCAEVSAVSVDDAGRWTCSAENAGGRASCSAHLNVLVPKAYKRPEFVEELRALLTEQGTVSLECKVVGVPTPVLRWFKDSKEIKAGDVFALTANAEDPTSLGTYTCEAVNCMGRAYSSSKVHVVGSTKPTSVSLEPPPIFTKELESCVVHISSPLALGCQLAVPPWPRQVVFYNKAGKLEPGDRYHVVEDGVGGYLVEVSSAEWCDEGEWKCVATSRGGRVGISTTYVTMEVPKNYRAPRFMENLQAVLTEEGLVSFECKVVGFPTPVLSWFKDGQELKPGDVYQLTGTNSLGSYCCIARNCMGQASSSAELTVEDIQNQLNEEEKLQLFAKNHAPKFLQGLKSVEAKIDEAFRFTVKVEIPPEPSVQWYRDSQPVDGSTRCCLAKENRGLFHLDIQNLELLDQAEWKCIATNDFGHSVTSCFLKLLIPRHYKKPRFLENLQAILSDEGAVNLECKVIGVPQPVLKWYKDGEELKPGDIHRIISGQDGTCCLGTYTCEARNCMGIAASSASLLGFDANIKAKQNKTEEQPLQRNLSLSTIHEERTSQMYDTPVGDITLDDKGEISFSFDGKEVSVSLYETPDLTEEEALQIVEMYADQLSENVTEHNVVELPPLRFVKETSTSGNLLMEAIIIDVSPDYFVTPEEDLRTEADVEDISIADENAAPQLSLDTDLGGEDYLEKTMALLSEEKSDIPKKILRKKSDSIKSGEDFYSLSREQSLSEDKKDDETQVSESFASAKSSAKIKSKSSKPSDEEFNKTTDITKTVPCREAQKHSAETEPSPVVKPKRERRGSRGSRRSSSGSEKSLSRSKDEPRKKLAVESETVPPPIVSSMVTDSNRLVMTDHEFITKMINVSSVISKVINDIQMIEKDIILKSELMSSAATASRSLEIINSLLTPLSEIHSVADASKETTAECKQVSSNLFTSLPQPLKLLQQSLTIINKCIDVESDSRTLVKRTCVAFVQTCSDDVIKIMSELGSVTGEQFLSTEQSTLGEVDVLTRDITNVLNASSEVILRRNMLVEISESKHEEPSLETKHLRDTQRAVFELRSPLNSLLCIAESAESIQMIDIDKVKHSDVILTDMSASIQDLQAALEQIESLSVKESTTSLHKYNTEIIEAVMESVLKLRGSFEQLSTETRTEEDKSVLIKALASIKYNLSEISAQIKNIENNIGTFDILQSENKLEVLQRMAQILIALENNLPNLEIIPEVKMHLDVFHKNLTKVLENVIESNDAKKYFTLIEICDAVNRVNNSIKNISSNNLLSLASLSNTLKIIEEYFIKNVFESELNCSILSNIADVLIGVQEAVNHADEISIQINSEHLQEISTPIYESSRAQGVLEQIDHTIAAINNVRSIETTNDLKNALIPMLETMTPILEDLRRSIASTRPAAMESEEMVSDISEISLAQTLASPIYDLNQNITIINQMLIENIDSIKDSYDFILTIAQPLLELHTTLEVIQQDVISQYAEDITTYEVNENVANAVRNLQSCIVTIQEQAGIEAIEEMSTLEDISGIKTTADTLTSDRLVLPLAEEVMIEQGLQSLNQDLAATATAQALQSLNEHITVLQTPEIMDALDSLSEVSDFSGLKSVAIGLGELHAGIEEVLHPLMMENSNELLNMDNSSKLVAIAEPMQELQQSLSLLEPSNIPVYEHILDLSTEKIHSVLETITQFKERLGKCIHAVFPAMEAANKTLEISNKVKNLRVVCENLNDIIKTKKMISLEVPLTKEVIALEQTLNDLLDATDVSKDIEIEKVKLITEKLYQNIAFIQEEIVQFTPHTSESLYQEALMIQAIDEIETNIAVLETYELVDLSKASDIASCSTPQLALEIESESLKQMDDIVEIAVNVVQDSTQDTPVLDLTVIEDFFKTCKNEFTILRYLMSKQLTHKKIIRILQEFSHLQSSISEFRSKRSQLKLSDDIDSYLTTFLVHADDCLKNLRESLIKIVQSQANILVKEPVQKLEDTKKAFQHLPEGKISPQIAEVAKKFGEVIDATKPFSKIAVKTIVEELNDSTINTKDEENILRQKMEEIVIFVEEQSDIPSLDDDSKQILQKVLQCIQKHEEYRDTIGIGTTLIILKCLSECSDVLHDTILESKPKSLVEHKIDDSALKAVLTNMLDPLQALHNQLISVQKQILSGADEDSISIDIPSTESLVQVMSEIHKEIQQVESGKEEVDSQEISLIMEVDKGIHTIQDSIRAMENIPAAQIVKEISKPIDEIEKSLHVLLSSDKIMDSKSKLSSDINSNINSLECALKRFIDIEVDLLEASGILIGIDIIQSVQIAFDLKKLLAFANKENSDHVEKNKIDKALQLKKILTAFDWLDTNKHTKGKAAIEAEKLRNIFLITYQLLVELDQVLQIDLKYEASEEKAKELVQHIDQYIELIEIIEETSAVIRIGKLQETANIARELKESIVFTEAIAQMQIKPEKEIEISPFQTNLAQTLQKAVSSLQVQVLDYAQELAPALGKEVLQRIAQVTAQLQTDLVAVTGVQVAIQAPDVFLTKVKTMLEKYSSQIDPMSVTSDILKDDGICQSCVNKSSEASECDKELAKKELFGQDREDEMIGLTSLVATECVQTVPNEDVHDIAEKIIPYQESGSQVEDILVVATTGEALTETTIFEKKEKQQYSVGPYEVQEKVTLENVDICSTQATENKNAIETLRQHIEAYTSDDVVAVIEKIVELTNTDQLKQTISIAHELHNSISVSNVDHDGDGVVLHIVAQDQKSHLAKQLQVGLSGFQTLTFDNALQLQAIDQNALLKIGELVTQLQNDLLLVANTTEINTSIAPIQLLEMFNLNDEKKVHCEVAFASTQATQVDNPQIFDITDIANMEEASKMLVTKENVNILASQFFLNEQQSNETFQVIEIENNITANIAQPLISDVITSSDVPVKQTLQNEAPLSTETVLDQKEYKNENLIDESDVTIKDQVLSVLEVAPVSCIVETIEKDTFTQGTTDITVQDKTSLELTLPKNNTVTFTEATVDLVDIGQRSLAESHPAKKKANKVSTVVYDSYGNPIAVELSEVFLMDKEKALDETETKLATVKTAVLDANSHENYIEICTPNVVTYASELSQLSHDGCSEKELKLEPVLCGVTLTANKSDDVSVIEPNILEITSMQSNNDNVEIHHDTVSPFREFESPVMEKLEETNNNNNQLPADYFTEKLISANSTDKVLGDKHNLLKEDISEISDTNAHFTEDSIVFTNKDLSQQVDNVVELFQFDVVTINKLNVENVCKNGTKEPLNVQAGFTLNLEKNVADNEVINVDEEQTRYSDSFNDMDNSENFVIEKTLSNLLINNQVIDQDKTLKFELVEETRLDEASEIDSVTKDLKKTRVDNLLIFCPNTQMILIEPEIEPIGIADNAIRTELDHTLEVAKLEDISIIDSCHLIQHIEEFISPTVLNVVEQLSESVSTEKLKESVTIAKELRETMAAVDVLAASKDTALVAEYAKEEQAKLAKNLQTSLSTLQMQVFDSEVEITSGIDPKTLEQVSEVIANLQDDLKTASISYTPEMIKVGSENVQVGGDENSMKKLAYLLQEVSDVINTAATGQSLDDTEELKDTLGEVQTVIIKLKRDGDGAGNDTLNETLEDLECSVRSVLLQINENSPQELLKEACAALQLLANNMSEIKEVSITETISVKPEDVLTQCSVDVAETVKLLQLASKFDVKENSPLINVVMSLRTLKDILKSLRESFLGDSETLIDRGVEVMETLNQVEENVFSLEKDLEIEINITSPLKENIVDALHSVYGSISNMRSTICTIQKQYMYDNYGKPSECILKSIKMILQLSRLCNEVVDACKWKKISKSLRNVLNHFEDIKFYINLDKTARLPSDAGFTKVILNDLKSNIIDVAPLVNNLSSSSTLNVDVMLQFLDKVLNDLETKSSLEVRQKIPLFKQLATQVLELTTNLLSGLESKESNMVNKLDSIEPERKQEQSCIESKNENNLLQIDNLLKEPLPSTSKVETIGEISLMDLSTSDQPENLKTGKSIKKRDSKKKREEERRKQEEQARINQDKEDANRIKHDLSSQNVEMGSNEYDRDEKRREEVYELKENVNTEDLGRNFDIGDTNLRIEDQTTPTGLSKENMRDMPEMEETQSKIISEREDVSNKESNESQAKLDKDLDPDKREEKIPIQKVHEVEDTPVIKEDSQEAKEAIMNKANQKDEQEIEKSQLRKVEEEIVNKVEEAELETTNKVEKVNSKRKQNAEEVCMQKKKEEIRTETMQDQEANKEANIERAIDVQEKQLTKDNNEENIKKEKKADAVLIKEEKEEENKIKREVQDVKDKKKDKTEELQIKKSEEVEEDSNAEGAELAKEKEEVGIKNKKETGEAQIKKTQEEKKLQEREAENIRFKKENVTQELCLKSVVEQEEALTKKEKNGEKIEKEEAHEEERRIKKEREAENSKLKEEQSEELRLKESKKEEKASKAEDVRLEKQKGEETRFKQETEERRFKAAQKEENQVQKEMQTVEEDAIKDVAKLAMKGKEVLIKKEALIENDKQSKEMLQNQINKEHKVEDSVLKKDNEAEELRLKKVEEANKEAKYAKKEKEAEELRTKKVNEDEDAIKTEEARLAKEKQEARIRKENEAEETCIKEVQVEETLIKKEMEAEDARLKKVKEAKELSLNKAKEEEATKTEEARLAKEKVEARIKNEKEADQTRIKKTQDKAEEKEESRIKEEKGAEEAQIKKEKEDEELRLKIGKEEARKAEEAQFAEEKKESRIEIDKEAEELRVKKAEKEDKAKKAEEARLAEEEEENRIKNEKEKDAEEARIKKEKEAEELRLKIAKDEEARKVEEARFAEEKEESCISRIKKEKEAEELRLKIAKEEEARKVEEARLAEKKEESRIGKEKEAEEARIKKEKEAEELRLKKNKEEEARKVEEARLAEQKEESRIRKEKEAEEARIKKEKEAEELRLKEEEARLAEEKKEALIKKEEEAEEARIKKEKEAEEARIKEVKEAEELRLKIAKEEEARKVEEARLAEKKEESRIGKEKEAEEARIKKEKEAEELRLKKNKEEEARKAEEARLAEQKEESRIRKEKEAEEARIKKEKEAEDMRLKKVEEEARKAEEARLAEEKEESRIRKEKEAEEARIKEVKEAEELRLKIAKEEEARKAEEARLAEEKEESRIKKEKEAEKAQIKKEKEAEELRLKKNKKEEARKIEEARLAEQKEESRIRKEKEAEQARIKKEKEAEELRLKEEEARLAEEKKEALIKKEKEAEEARIKKEKEAEDMRLKKVEEEARKAEEARLAEEKEKSRIRKEKEAEEVRIKEVKEAEELRLKIAKEEEARKAEEARLAEEKEESRIKKEKEAEEAQIKKEKEAEELRLKKNKEEEARKIEEARLAEQKEESRIRKEKEAEEARIKKEKEAEELRLKEEEARLAEEKKEALIKKEKEAEEARIKKEKEAEDLRLKKVEEEARKAEEARLAEEKEESRIRKEKEAEEARIKEVKEAEELRLKIAKEEEARKAEEARLAEEKEESRIKKEKEAEEAQIKKEKEAEELRLKKNREEEARKIEEARLAEQKEESRIRKEKEAEEARIKKEKEAEELRLNKEEARMAEERKEALIKKEKEAKEARIKKEKEAEELRLKKVEEEARKAEEARLAEEKEESCIKKEKEAQQARIKKEKEAEELRLKKEEARLAEGKEEARIKKEKETEEAQIKKEKEAEELRLKKTKEEEARKAEEAQLVKDKEEARTKKEKEAEESLIKEEENQLNKKREAKVARLKKEKEAEELRVKKAKEEKGDRKAEEARLMNEIEETRIKKEKEAEEAQIKIEKEAEELRLIKAKEEEAMKAELPRLVEEKEESRIKKENKAEKARIKVAKEEETQFKKGRQTVDDGLEKEGKEFGFKKGQEEEAKQVEEARLIKAKEVARLNKEKEAQEDENRDKKEREAKDTRIKNENELKKGMEAEEYSLKKEKTTSRVDKSDVHQSYSERQDRYNTKGKKIITLDNDTRNHALIENGDEKKPLQIYETSGAKLQEPLLDSNQPKEFQKGVSDYRNYEYDSATVRRKYDEKEKPRFVDHDYKDYTMEFAKPSGYRERCFDQKSLLSERESYGISPMIYKAHTIALDSQLRSFLPPISDVARSNDLEKRSEVRQRSKAISEARSVISEKRSSVPRDIKRKPVFSTYLTDRTAVEGSRVKLTCSVLSSGDPIITWYKNGIVLENKLKYKTKYVDGLITLEVLNAVPSDSAEYNCTVENENGSISSSANLKVYPSFEASPIPPTFTRSIRDAYHLAENELLLECRIRGQPLPTITWFKDDRLISNNERYQSYYLADGVCCLAICQPSPEDSGKYTCKAENSVWSDQITHIVNFTGQESRLSPNIATIERSRFNRAAMVSRRPHFGNVLTDYKVVKGGTIGLQVEIQGCPTRVEWLREGRSVIDIYGNARTFAEQGLYTLALSDVTEKESGMYTCRAWSTYGTVDMNAAITVVQPTEMEGRPAIIVGRPEKDVLISVGEDLNISFRVQGEPKPKVAFMKGIRDITNSQRVCKMTSDDYVKFTVKRSVVSDAGTYCILARNAYGCDRAFVTVVVRQRESSENLISDWTYPADDSVHTIVDRQYKCVPERVGSAPRVSDSGSGWVSLVWERAESRGAPVLAYRVDAWRLGADGGARWQQLGVTPLPSFDAFNLRAGDEYHFRVTPRNRHGWGEPVQTAVPVAVPAQLDRPDFVDALPGQLKVLVGDTAVLECTVRGRPHPDVIWMKNGHELEEPRAKVTFNGHRCRLTITDVCIDDDARYSCEASNAHGRTSTYARLAVVNDRMLYEADAKLKRERSLEAVGEYPPQFTMRLRDRRVQATYPVRLTCQVVGSPAPDVTWYKDGTLLDNDDRHTVSVDEHFHTLEIAPTSLEDGGVYEALARNHRGAVSCRCSLLVDKGIRAYIAPEFCCGLEPLYRLNEGEELRISAVVEAYPSVGVTWYRDGVRLRPSRRAIMTLDHDGQIELALAAVTLRDQGVYSCTASNEVGSATTSGKLQVIGDDRPDKKPSPPVLIGPDVPYSAEPMFIRKPRSSEAREGDTVIIACEVVGDPKPDVYWLRDFLKPDYYRDAVHFRRVGGGPEYRFEIPHAKLDYTGAYSVLARNIHGEAKAVISLQILARDPNSTEEHNVRYGRVEVLPRFERELTDMLCYDGDAVEFQCRVSGHPEPDLRWFHCNEVIRNSEEFELSYEDGTARLRIRQVMAEDEGTYVCEASNTLGKATSTACLVVYPGGEPNTLRQRLRRPAALVSAQSTPRSTPARSMSRTPAPEPRRACSPSRQMAPKFYTYPFNKVAEPGDRVVMQCAVRGLPVPWTTWDKDGIILTPNTRITIREKDDMLRILEIDNVTVEDVGVYRVTVENDFGRVEATARLEVVSGGRFHGALAPATTPRRRSVSRND